MKWNAKKRKDIEGWHRHFAWGVVRLTEKDRFVWLEWVERRYVIGQFDIYAEYREISN